MTAMMIAIVKRTAMAVLLLAAGVVAAAAQDEAALWAAVRDGDAVAMMRHALAPGTGDPSVFDVADCSTQRNLSDEGRAQARRIGERFRDNGIAAAEIRTSAWCRCRDTAELLDLGAVRVLEPLNSFFRRSAGRGPQTQALKDWLNERSDDGPLVLVTHQVNITALTGVYPSSGETVIFRISEGGAVSVFGTVETP
jgi:phosphohistidine phosphatase SixA